MGNENVMGWRERNIFCICIDQFQDSGMKGRLYHRYSDSAILLTEVCGFILEMERVFDNINYPQAAVQSRRYVDFIQKKNEYKELKLKQQTEEIMQQKGKKCTFVIHVQYRQNATWQGRVSWIEKNMTKQFRSVLELIKLLYSALENECSN